MSKKPIDNLFSAIKRENVLTLKKLITSADDVNISNEHGWTALMFAASNKGNSEIIRLLVQKGADVNALNKFGDSALSLAALKGYKKAIVVLLDAGASVDVKPQEMSLLQYIKWGNHDVSESVFEILKKAGAS